MGNKDKKNKGISREKLWKIWSRLGSNWLTIAQEFKHNHHFQSVGQGRLRGKCIHPEHSETEGSFYLNYEKGFTKCYGCDRYESNPLKILSLIMDKTQGEVLQYLHENYNISFLSSKAIAELEAIHYNQMVKEEIFEATHQYMCSALSDPTKKEFASAKTTLDWLINTRAIPSGAIHLLPIGIMPELERLTQQVTSRFALKQKQYKHRADSTETPPVNVAEGVVEYLRDYMLSDIFTGAVVFPLHINPSEIGRIKLRAPIVSSNKTFIIPEDPYEDGLGLFGLGWQPYNIFETGKTKSHFVYLTEGEMDVLSPMARFAETGKFSYPLLSAGGKGGSPYIEPILDVSGISDVFLIGDAPSKKGNEVVQNWLNSIHHLNVKVFTGWDSFPGAFDLDEAVVKLGEPQVSKVIWGQFDKHFTPAWSWAASRASDELDGIPEDDLRKRIEIAAEHGGYLRNRLECEAYADHISQRYSLNPHILKRQIAQREDTENGFILRCYDALQELLFTVGTRSTASNRSLVTYIKSEKRFSEIKLDNEQSITQELSPIIGTAYDFIDKRVGFPSFLITPEDNPEGKVRKKLNDELRFYLKEAVLSMAQGTPDIATTRKYRQGYHRILTPEREKVEYIVCGADIFKIKRDGNAVDYQKLDGPLDNGIVFDIGLERKNVPEPWYPGGLDVKELNAYRDTNIKQLYEELVHLYDIGFTFKHQEVTTKLLAALVLLYPIMDVFVRPLLLFVTGDTSSGKTSLLSTFSGTDDAQIQLLYASHNTQDYTAASVASMVDSSSLLAVLDEFESGDTARGRQVRLIFEMLRSLLSGATYRMRGRPDGSYQTNYLRFPVILSAIQGAERPQDLNRLLLIEMQKIKGKNSPANVILDEFGGAKIEQMAKQIATIMFPHALTLAAYEKEILQDFKGLQSLMPFPVEWRYASSLFSVLALLRFLEEDWKAFFKDFLVQNEATIIQASTVSESETLLKGMLYHAVIKSEENPNGVSIGNLLTAPESRHEINTSSCGVYYDADNRLLLLLLEQAVPKLLQRTLPQGTTGIYLKNTLERHPAALKPHEIQSSGILRKIGPYLGAGIHAQDVVVFHADEWLDSPYETMEEVEAKEEEKAAKAQTEQEQATEKEPEEKPDAQKSKKKAKGEPDNFGWQ